MANVVPESFRNIYDFCITHLPESKETYNRYEAYSERATRLKDTLHSEFWDPGRPRSRSYRPSTVA